MTLNPIAWHGTALGTECTFHQIAPYIGKMKSTMAREIIKKYSSPGDLILDPFAGSGAVGLESAIAGRKVICTDINPYAVILTKAKLTAPKSLEEALEKANDVLKQIPERSFAVQLETIPEWVKAFFHPKTLQEVISFAAIVQEKNDTFLMACLLGILHHQRPGFLSYPSSHLVPYLRTNKFPKKSFPELYEYRPLEPRLIAKIKRLYRRPAQGNFDQTNCYQADVRTFKLDPGCVDTIITSPPYMDALDYARDNRLRLWFLGVEDYKQFDAKYRSLSNFYKLMTEFLTNASKWLRTNGYCACVVGEVSKKNKSVDIANMIANIAINKIGSFEVESIITDEIPDDRRSRKGSYVKTESVVVLKKGGKS
ncbi:MAG: DNA methyltransferase [Candidatus Bathyarchaeia archaeon]